ncbi:GRIP and coiled-coil domain-containing protein 2 isoform X1 [Drosophila rhopaloa]|uniref:Trichohyalin n=2 Tax=Drosophila rhopaloa TaxID=1041015 RepID=A0ABM5HS40_DRORH|nr:GRIP and coiled-coil domain-containing protein 2 isoform X1 [Drosophila rhopaloa]
MDLRSWRKVLLQWVSECRFTEANYITLEQTDIEAFFAVFVEKAQVEAVVQEALQAQPKNHRSPLQAFIREIYPEFCAHISGRGKLVESDYLYVYTLLLHYSCVKQPSMFFHSLCKKLPELMQTCIAALFEKTVERQLTRDYLRQTIANVASVYRLGAQVSPCHPSSSLSPDLHSDVTPSPTSSTPTSPQPPSSTPHMHHRDRDRQRERLRLQLSANEMPAPPTPKTELLEQRTRELRGVRAQLAMICYEKNVLEEQHVEKDSVIQSLNKENHVVKTQLAKLKDNAKTKEEEDVITDCAPKDFDHLKRSLMKEISQKEAIITENNDKLQDLQTEKSELVEKLKMSAEQLLVCMDRVRELESRVEDLSQSLSTKDDRISCLERDKQELNECLQEAREDLHNRREVLNASSDLLNLSLSPNVTPENLASSVIDKQLREKEHENAELREELQRQNDSVQQLTEAMTSILRKYQLDQDFLANDQFSHLMSSISVLESGLADELARSSKLKKLCDSQSSNLDELLEKSQTIGDYLETQLKQLDAAKAKIVQLERAAADTSQNHMKKVCNMQKEYEDKIHSQNCRQEQLQSHLQSIIRTHEKLIEKVAVADDCLTTIKVELAEKEQQIERLSSEITDLRGKNESLESSISRLGTERKEISLLLEQEQRSQEYLRNKYTLCRNQLMSRNADMGLLSMQLGAADWESALQRIDELFETEEKHGALKLELEQKAMEAMEATELGMRLELSLKHSQDMEQKLSDLQLELDTSNDRCDKLHKSNLKFTQQIESDLLERETQHKELYQEKEYLIEQQRNSQQETELFLDRITALLDGGNSARSSACSSGPEENSNRFDAVESLLEVILEQRKQTIDSLEAKVDYLLEDLADVKRQHAAVLSESRQWAFRFSREEKQREELIVSLELTADKLRSALHHKDTEIANSSRQVAELQKTLQEERTNLEQATNRLVGTQQHLKAQNLEVTKIAAALESRLLEAGSEPESPDGGCANSSEALRHRIVQFISIYDELDACRQDLELKCDGVTQLAEHLGQSKVRLEEEVAILQNKLGTGQNSPMIKQLKDTIGNLEQVNEKLSLDNVKLHNLQLDMSQSLLKVHSESNRRADQISQLETSENYKARQLSESQKVQEELRAQLKETDEKMSELKDMYEKQIDQLKVDHDQRCKDLENEMADKIAEISLVSKEHDTLIDIMKQELEGKLEASEAKFLKQEEEHKQLLKTTKDECEQRCQDLERQLTESSQLVKDHEEAVTAIRTELKEARLQEQQHRDALATNKQEMSGWKSDLNEARLQEKTLRQTIATHKELMQESSNELAWLRDARKKAEVEVAKLRAQVSQGQTDNKDHVKLESKPKEQEPKLNEEELLSLRTKLQDEQKLTEQLRVEVEKQNEQLCKANAQMKNEESRMAEMVNEVEKDYQMQFRQLKESLAKEQLEIQQKMVDTCNIELLSLQTKLQDEQMLTDQLKVKLEKQKNKLTKAKALLISEGSRMQQMADEAERDYLTQFRLLKETMAKEHHSALQDLQMMLSNNSKEELLSLQAKLQDEQKLTDELKVELDERQKELCKAKAQLIGEESRMKKIAEEAERDNQMQLQQLKEKMSKEQQSAQQEQELLSDSCKEDLLSLQAKLRHEQKLTDQLKAELDELRLARAQVISDGNYTEKIFDEQVKLIEQQADELAQTKKALESQVESSTKLLAEKESLQREIHLVKERLVNEEREHQVKLATLEDELETLMGRHTQTEADRAIAHERISKLKNVRDLQQENIVKLNKQLSEFDQLKDSLNCEIGGLNCNIAQQKKQLSERAGQIMELQHRLEAEVENRYQAQEQLAKVTERLDEVEQQQSSQMSASEQAVADLQHRLETEIADRKQARQQLAEITEQLAGVQQELDGTRLVHEAQHFELEEKTREIEMERAEAAERNLSYQRRLENLERQLADCNQELAEMRSANESHTQGPSDLGATYSKSDAPESDANLGQLRQETARNNQLALDCQILQAKYRDAKNEIQRCEQKIKDQRLEMEGKLDKMKTKMRSLYTAEVTRMKEKQERDAASSAAELETLKAQNAKYEEHTRKLSNQIVRLNEKILEQQKQHAIISTKLRHLQMQPASEPKPSTATITVSSSSAAASEDWQPFKRPSAPSSNLAMEDEEGEVFNNTYLTDLKLGRVPDMTAEELIYRNSLQPPHLKSAYAAQYDLGSQDEDLKDGPHSLDDSMSALLSSSSTGTRKKTMGTHYKRPGPPTPSKNGGRLSFGSSEPPREILREFGDHNNTSKTPARFKFLTQRFSVGSSGLPRDELPHRKRSNLLTGIQRRKLRQAVGLFCTSTPRKSRSYYDQQRLIRASDADTSSAEPAEQEEEVDEVEDVDEVEEVDEVDEGETVPPEDQANQEGTPHLSTAALLALTKGNTRRLTGHAKSRNGRVSLCLHGNIFAKSRPAALKVSDPAVLGKRVQQRRKLRQERMGRFDQARHLDQVRLSANLSNAAQKPDSPDNNNYSMHNRNEEQIVLGKTVVLDKRAPSPAVATTFSVGEALSETWQLQQQFESENLATWALENGQSAIGMGMEMEESPEDWRFEQLCRETECTAPFQLQPLVYAPVGVPVELKLPQLAASSSNLTGGSCTTNMTSGSCTTNMTSTSSRQSCTVYSFGSVHMQPMPHINITYVQPTDSQLHTSTLNRSLWTQFRRLLRHLSLGERLTVGLVLLAIVGLCSQLADRVVLAFTAVVAGMGLVLLTISFFGRKPKQWKLHKSH